MKTKQQIIFESRLAAIGINQGCMATRFNSPERIEYCNEHINWLWYQFVRADPIVTMGAWANSISPLTPDATARLESLITIPSVFDNKDRK